MGNTVVWKPSPTQTFAAYLTMQLLEAAGLPPGVINLLAGDGIAVSDVALADPRLAGIHFTGSTGTFQHLWREVGTNIDRYHTYPRLVGETGGKDFVLAHPSARPDVLRTALIRGAFDYQGQKCSAASRAFVPRSVWQQMGDDFLGATEALRYGDVTDLTNFGGALIDDRVIRQERQGHRTRQGCCRRHGRRRRRIRRQRRLFRPADGAAVRRPGRRVVLHRVLRADPVGVRVSRLGLRADVRRGRHRREVRADRSGDRRRSRAVLQAENRLRLRGGQLLRQRQAHRRRRGPAAVRRFPRVGHQRQGRFGAEPAAVDVGPVDQGDLRPGDRPQLPAHGGRSDGRRSFHRVARPAILAASRSDGLRRTAERLPVTRDVVHRFVPGETVADALNSVAQLRDSRRLVSIDYLGEDTTDVEDAETTVRGLPGTARCARRTRRNPQQCRAAAGGVAEAVRARSGAAAGRREDRPGQRPHHLRAGAARRRVGDRRCRGPHHHRLDAVDRARPACRVPLAGHRFAVVPEAHAGRLRGVRRLRCPDQVVQGRLRRAGVGRLPRPRRGHRLLPALPAGADGGLGLPDGGVARSGDHRRRAGAGA